MKLLSVLLPGLLPGFLPALLPVLWMKPQARPPGQDPEPIPDEQEREATSDPEAARTEREYFEICDYDGNGWISYKEAQESLGVDRNGYSVYDRDRDGRITRPEWDIRYREVVKIAGGIPPPKPSRSESLVPGRNPEQLRSAYDKNGDRIVDLEELAQLLAEYEKDDIPSEFILDKLDEDRSGALDIDELDRLSQLLSSTYEPADEVTEPLDPDEVPPMEASTIDELFGGVVFRNLDPDTVPQPPYIRGPAPHFRRLDLDNDGAISDLDLRTLQAPVQLPIRTRAIISALDKDEDGALSREEFLEALN